MTPDPEGITAVGGFISMQCRNGMTAFMHPDRAAAWLDSDSLSAAAKDALRAAIEEARGE